MAKLMGIDVGSTTVKVCVLSETYEILYTSYERHFARVKECVLNQLSVVEEKFGGGDFRICITGSAGLGLAERSGVGFVQEVQAAFTAIRRYYPDADAAVELGGEDAKIIFVTGGTEQRMNGSCAGGTGAFIDQMATLLNISVTEMDELSLKAEKVYPIASRCGVFAKSDIQPLLNQGARKEDISASIFQAVVDQTVAGLAQGRRIKGKVLFLGGPLYFLKGLRRAFKETLKLDDEHAVFPDNAPCFMSVGAALYAENVDAMPLSEAVERIKNAKNSDDIVTGEPLFKDRAEYDAFVARHKASDLAFEDIRTYAGDAYLGIDSGSTTTKLVLITPDCKLLYEHYQSNNGQPLDIVLERLREIYSLSEGRIRIAGAATTGYGEDLIKAAIKADFGIVETVAHFKAALYFNPKVDFIIDIGGQDIKCFKIKNGAIDNIMLNEACSSGCGSFIQTFAKAMGMEIDEFSRLGLFAKHPVELGSRCTVFMNSSVKQAQKEGASVEDISAGLSSSIVKNAIYKVIRAKTPDELGSNILVQGGTFLNDAVLRSFEIETGKQVVRPGIAGLMGAFGAALYAKENVQGASTVITEDELKYFTYSSRSHICKGCTSHCNVNVIGFSDGRKFISGNKCEKGAGLKPHSDELDIYAYKYDRIRQCRSGAAGKKRGRVGLPLVLGFYEQLPLWSGFFEACGFEVVFSEKSSRQLYFRGQHTVASDTVCYPAKLAHGHIESLLDADVDFIFYPCESYNLDEHDSANHYNCPVVAYYPELLKANNERLTDENFVMPYIDLNDKKTTVRALHRALKRYKLSRRLIKKGLKEGFARLQKFQEDVHEKGNEISAGAEKLGIPVIILAGRPYHVDPEINHGIGKLLTSLNIAVLSEDSVFFKGREVLVNVLNQWTYHARLYRAAEYATEHDNVNLVQLVSFGCGIDAITTDEVRSILESRGKLYTQIKIDEINNLGVVKIRLRSMLAAIEEQKRHRAKQ
ncbi:MAG TPA: 2-hydroxyacyl-CoA dehydratase [Candidatus Borkfalkia avicola]|uniref:2-hydroxyacyl-CoA dehydratase n=1 Tax=Candidatus Borkfalkia avicola TaxID=2838503 RepID=A0A9D2D619_9FIRM|nr:2-hydroxyacyl-CoA dehydratase [Candidatus Borkfalkia avicola]